MQRFDLIWGQSLVEVHHDTVQVFFLPVAVATRLGVTVWTKFDVGVCSRGFGFGAGPRFDSALAAHDCVHHVSVVCRVGRFPGALLLFFLLLFLLSGRGFRPQIFATGRGRFSLRTRWTLALCTHASFFCGPVILSLEILLGLVVFGR